MSEHDPRLELVQRYADGLATSSDMKKLEAALRADPHFLTRCVEYLALDSALGDALALTAAERAPSERITPPVTLRSSRRALLAGLAAAACLVFAFVIFNKSHDDAPSTGTGLGLTIALTDAPVHVQRAREDRMLVTGNAIFAGDVLTTGDGTTVLAYLDEATRLTLRPGTVLECADALHGKHFQLRAGVVAAEVAPQPKDAPMLITTPHARATVLGTRFTLQAAPSESRIAVAEGKVLFTCSFNAKQVVVNAGFSSTSDRTGPTSVVPIK